ncbi:MAG: hypothetical protein DRI56_08830 [Chloroflexota bacterium]|nr:MAG: hypothetical protein DRI56_08830 [Chloroflexota bacterium]
MELEQLEKRIEWLDEEHRKDKHKIAELEDKLLSLDGKLNATQKKNVELDGEVTRLRATIARIDSFDEALANIRVDSNRTVKELERQTKNWIADAKTLLRTQMQGIDASVLELRGDLAPISTLEKKMLARIDEEHRLSGIVAEIKKNVADVQSDTEEQLRQYRLLKEERQKETKRLTDLNGEIIAIRKYLDEQRGRMDLVEVDNKNVKVRLEELANQRRELLKEQEKFIETQSLQSTERERTWKTWQTRFEIVEKQAADIDVQLQSLDTTHRSIKHMQEDVSELSAQIERRMNEIIEMQRLSEERSRLEWNTFKADDQKRWMNYTLSQKEQRDEAERHIGRLGERITILEDTVQDAQDQVRQVSAQIEKQLQSLLTLSRDWVSEYEQVMDSVR